MVFFWCAKSNLMVGRIWPAGPTLGGPGVEQHIHSIWTPTFELYSRKSLLVWMTWLDDHLFQLIAGSERSTAGWARLIFNKIESCTLHCNFISLSQHKSSSWLSYNASRFFFGLWAIDETNMLHENVTLGSVNRWELHCQCMSAVLSRSFLWQMI